MDRPSWQSRLLVWLLRTTVKPALARRPVVAAIRRHALRLDRLLGRPTREVTIVPAPLPTCDAEWIVPDAATPGPVILYLPGGAFVMRTPAIHRALAARIARATGSRVMLVFYRLAPEQPFPAARDDALAAYERLIVDGVAPEHIVLGGDSAGGNLVLATMFALRDQGRPLPAGAFVLSPAADLRGHEDGSRLSNREADAMLSMAVAAMIREAYAGGRDECLELPGFSPVLGDYRMLPPLLVQVGSTEILLDDARRTAQRASDAGVAVEFEAWNGMPHVWHAAAFLPEAGRAISRIADFVRRCVIPAALPSPATRREPPMPGLAQEASLPPSPVIRHADRHHGDVESVPWRVEGDIHRRMWRDLHARSKQGANAPGALGVGPGEAVGTPALNGQRHPELYFEGSSMVEAWHPAVALARHRRIPGSVLESAQRGACSRLRFATERGHLARRASMPVISLDPGLALKIAPPKARRTGLSHAWLARLHARLADYSVAVVSAPSGFGKTTLLSDWRRRCLACGWRVGWVAVDARDDDARFISALAASLGVATGHPRFGFAAREAAQISGGSVDAMTALLAEVIGLSHPIALILDDAHELSGTTASELLAYLLHNLPSNLRVVIGTRRPLPVDTAELLARGEMVAISSSDLRLRVEETIEYLRARFGGRLDADACARAHDIADGWPIAVELVASALESDPGRAVASVSGDSGNFERFFGETVLARLSPREADFAVACSMLDAIHPDLCRAMTGLEDARELLDRLQRTTPILAESEGTDWLSMHPLVRASFAAQLAAFPSEQRSELHWRAAQWLHEHADSEAAAGHALASGRTQVAYDWIGTALFASSMNGRMSEVLGWADRLPPEVLALPMVRIGVAWAQALSYRPQAALASLAPIASSEDVGQRYQAALIRAAIAIWADDLDAAEKCIEPWDAGSPITELRTRQIHANVIGYLMIQDGELERARFEQAMARESDPGEATDLPAWYGEWIVGITYLIESRPRLSEQSLRPALERAERRAGRRSVPACTLSTALAAACWDLDRRSEVESILAYRMDVIERTGPPEAVMLVHVLLARAAWSAGEEARAIDFLQQLQMLGEHRRQPRLAMYAFAEQIRLQAGARRADTCAALAERLEIAWNDAARREVSERRAARLDLLRRMAGARVSIVEGRDERARAELEASIGIARRIGRTRDGLEARALLAMVSDPEEPAALTSLREVLSIAEANGNVRLFADAHPGVIPVIREFTRRMAPEDGGASPAFIEHILAGASAGAAGELPRPRVAAPALLTMKEASILELLARGLSNKEIARAIDVGHETVKWHLKNLFGKLGAGSRRHAVDRARSLGLIQEGRPG